MKKRIFSIILVVLAVLCLCGCSNSELSKSSTFSIQFIDVGQGDSALIECDGRYMLIDGGDEAAGDKYQFGSAEIEVVDVASSSENDSLVLMITYGETRFLFIGDVEDDVQTRISDKYENEKDEVYKIDLIKMPHHGSINPQSVNGTSSLYRFIRTFMPDYAVISVGQGNMYGYPHRETLDLLDDADVKVYRTDMNGDIIVHSDGKTVSIECSK